MTDAERQLLELLDIERLEVDLFRGTGSGGETPTRIYGGQVIAQALAAAYRTVETGCAIRCTPISSVPVIRLFPLSIR